MRAHGGKTEDWNLVEMESAVMVCEEERELGRECYECCEQSFDRLATCSCALDDSPISPGCSPKTCTLQ